MEHTKDTEDSMNWFDRLIHWIVRPEGTFFILTLTLMAIAVSDIVRTSELVSQEKTAYIKENQCEKIAMPNSNQSGYRCIVSDKEEYMHDKQLTEIAKNKVRNRETPSKA